MQKKNPLLAAVLGFFLGPFGLLYVSLGGAAKALAYVFFLTLISSGLLGFPTWVGCAVYGWYLADVANKKAEPSATRFEEAREGLIEEGWEPDPSGQQVAPDFGTESPRQDPGCACGAELRPGARFCAACGAPTKPLTQAS